MYDDVWLPASASIQITNDRGAALLCWSLIETYGPFIEAKIVCSFETRRRTNRGITVFLCYSSLPFIFLPSWQSFRICALLVIFHRASNVNSLIFDIDVKKTICISNANMYVHITFVCLSSFPRRSCPSNNNYRKAIVSGKVERWVSEEQNKTLNLCYS